MLQQLDFVLLVISTGDGRNDNKSGKNVKYDLRYARYYLNPGYLDRLLYEAFYNIQD